MDNKNLFYSGFVNFIPVDASETGIKSDGIVISVPLLVAAAAPAHPSNLEILKTTVQKWVNKGGKQFKHKLNEPVEITIDGQLVFDGGLVFSMKDTHGVPVDLIVEEVIVKNNHAISWHKFIDAARKHGWYDYQAYECVLHALEDAGLSRSGLYDGIKYGMQRYIMETLKV